MTLSPKAKRLVLYLLDQHRLELISYLDCITDADEISDTANDLGFVETLIEDIKRNNNND